MSDTSAPATTDAGTAAPATTTANAPATTANAAAPANASPPPINTAATFPWPDPRPSDDADFVCPKKGDVVNGEVLKTDVYVEATVIAAKLSCSQSGNGAPDQVDLVFRVEPKQYALMDGDYQLSDVGGRLVFGTNSFNGGAYDITLKGLQRCGFDPQKAVAAYARDAKAIALVSLLKSSGNPADGTPERIAQTLGMVALQRGDLVASGLGSKKVRIVVKNDTYKDQVRRRLGFINSIPAPVEENDVLKLVRNLPSLPVPGAARAAAPARQGATSAAPAPGGKPNDDDIKF